MTLGDYNWLEHVYVQRILLLRLALELLIGYFFFCSRLRFSNYLFILLADANNSLLLIFIFLSCWMLMAMYLGQMDRLFT